MSSSKALAPDDDAGTTKTLMHALLCARDGPCVRSDCSSDVQAVKDTLKKMESHSHTCNIGGNIPGRRKKECATCTRWRQLQKLRDRLTRQLLQLSAHGDGARANRSRPSKAAQPPLMKRSLTMLMQSVEDDELDLALLPQLVEGELAAQRQRRPSVSMRSDDANRVPVSIAAASASDDVAGDPVRRICGLHGCTKVAWHSGMCQIEISERRRKRSRVDRVEGSAVVELEDEAARVQRMITAGARLAQTPTLKGSTPGRRWPRPPTSADRARASGITSKCAAEAAHTVLETEAPEEEEDAFPPTDGVHIVIDRNRRQGGALPNTWDAIATAPPHERSNVAEVCGTVHADGSCDATLVCHEGAACSGRCGAGTLVGGVRSSHRQIVCSTCLHANLPHALPTLRCSACDMLLPAGSRYRRASPVGDDVSDVSLCIECMGKLFSRYDTIRGALLRELDDEACKLREADFATLSWQPEHDREFDDFVQCTSCERWHHYVCAHYPAPEQLPRAWRMEAQSFVCEACLPLAPTTGRAAAQRRVLEALQSRRAFELPTCVLSEAIEREIAASLKEKAIVTPTPIVVRVISRKRMLFEAPKDLKQRYGAAYAPEFPYLSQGIFAFQNIGGRDVCIFAMYVQEYDSDCPPPNTNRTYISYLDSVPYLESDPPGARTPVYAAVLHGYLRHAAQTGFEHAHIWVAPPEKGTEYIFHCRPFDPRPPMTIDALRTWYERLLGSARSKGIVRSFQTLTSYTAGLQSMRDFPLFHGDFFPEKVHDIVEQGKQAAAGIPGGSSKGKGKASGQGPRLQRSETLAIANRMKDEVRSSQYAFLVARLATPDRSVHVPRENHIGPHELVDDREHFLEMCTHRHWQCDDLRRAQWTTMMLLAVVGGLPDV